MLYSVKEIREVTGLERKDLFVLEKSIAPASRMDNAGFSSNGKEHRGYKLYDRNGLKKLYAAALFRKLGMRLNDINKMFSSGNIDYEKTFLEIERKAREAEQQAADIITIVSTFKMLVFDETSISLYRLDNLHETAEKIRQSFDSLETNNLAEKLENADINKKLIDIYREFEGYTEEQIDSQEVIGLIEKLKNFVEVELALEPARGLRGLAIALQGAKEYIREIEDETCAGLPGYIGAAIDNYQLTQFFDEGDKVLDELEMYIDKDFSYPEIRNLLEQLALLLKKCFGLRDYEEYISFINMLKQVYMFEGASPEELKVFNYIQKAFEYYKAL